MRIISSIGFISNKGKNPWVVKGDAILTEIISSDELQQWGDENTSYFYERIFINFPFNKKEC